MTKQVKQIYAGTIFASYAEPELKDKEVEVKTAQASIRETFLKSTKEIERKKFDKLNQARKVSRLTKTNHEAAMQVVESDAKPLMVTEVNARISALIPQGIPANERQNYSIKSGKRRKIFNVTNAELEQWKEIVESRKRGN